MQVLSFCVFSVKLGIYQYYLPLLTTLLCRRVSTFPRLVEFDRDALIPTDVVESCVRCTVLHFSAANPRSTHTAATIRSSLVGPCRCCVHMIRCTNVFKTHRTCPVDMLCILITLNSTSILDVDRVFSGHLQYDSWWARVRRPRRMPLAIGMNLLRAQPMYIPSSDRVGWLRRRITAIG
jgi:hypothetical protein